MKKILTILIISLILININSVFALHWGKSTYTCDRNRPEINLHEQMDGCIEGEKIWWTFKIWTKAEDESGKETLKRIKVMDIDEGIIAYSDYIDYPILRKEIPKENPVVVTKLEGTLPAPTRGNTLTYTFCFYGEDEDFYGDDKSWSSCSFDTVSMYVLSRSEVECKGNLGCKEDEFCKDYKCVKLECGECQYISNHKCMNYKCCENEDCEKDEFCLKHSCEKLECNFLQKRSNHECKLNYFLFIILAVIIIGISSGIYLLKKKKFFKKKRKKKK